MKKILLLLLLLFAVACGGPEAPVTEATDTNEPETAVSTTTEETSSTDTDEEASSSTEEHADAVTSAAVPDGFTPASTPADAGEVRDFDHIKGATDPAVTIIEYGDYQ